MKDPLKQTCQVKGCRNPGVVGLNQKIVCQGHIESEMTKVFAPIKGLGFTSAISHP